MVPHFIENKSQCLSNSLLDLVWFFTPFPVTSLTCHLILPLTSCKATAPTFSCVIQVCYYFRAFALTLPLFEKSFSQRSTQLTLLSPLFFTKIIIFQWGKPWAIHIKLQLISPCPLNLFYLLYCFFLHHSYYLLTEYII